MVEFGGDVRDGGSGNQNQVHCGKKMVVKVKEKLITKKNLYMLEKASGKLRHLLLYKYIIRVSVNNIISCPFVDVSCPCDVF